MTFTVEHRRLLKFVANGKRGATGPAVRALLAAYDEAVADAKHAVAMYEAFTEITERTLNDAPGLPLEVLQAGELDRWTTAIMTILVNLGALNTLWREPRAAWIAECVLADDKRDAALSPDSATIMHSKPPEPIHVEWDVYSGKGNDDAGKD